MTQLKITLPVVTIEDIRSWYPYGDPATRFGLAEGWSGNALDFLDAKGNEELGDDERLLGILQVEMLPEPLLSEVIVAIVRETPLGGDAGTVNDLLRDPGRVALDARLKWSLGELNDAELEAARDAAHDDVRGQALIAIQYAGLAAEWATTRDAAEYATSNAALAAAKHAVLETAENAILGTTENAVRDAVLETAENAAYDAALAAQVKIARRVIQEATK